MEKIDFEIVDGDWIKKMQDTHRVSNKLLAKMINVDQAMISKYRGGQSMTGATKAALFWVFKHLER